MTDGGEVKTVSGIEIEAAALDVDARVENKISALAPEQLEAVRTAGLPFFIFWGRTFIYC